jgi:hypothetical protein
MKFDASQLSAIKQSLLDIGIKVGVFAALVVLNYISAGLTNGSINLPPLLLGVLSLLVSQADSFFIDYAGKHNVPVPQQ